MLSLFYGTDRDSARAKMKATLLGAQKKRPDAEVFKIDAANFSAGELDAFAGGAGLFEKKYIVCVDGVCERKEFLETIIERLPALQETENLFLFLEGKIDAKSLEKFKKHSYKVEEFKPLSDAGRKFGTGPSESFALKDFNIFALTDMLGKRDKKNLWVLYRKAVELEIASEEIAGVLFWQIKSMLIASGASTAGEAGLNPFVFSKSKSYAKNFKEGELAEKSSEMVSLYHDAHRGIHEFEIALERFVLAL